MNCHDADVAMMTAEQCSDWLWDHAAVEYREAIGADGGWPHKRFTAEGVFYVYGLRRPNKRDPRETPFTLDAAGAGNAIPEGWTLATGPGVVGAFVVDDGGRVKSVSIVRSGDDVLDRFRVGVMARREIMRAKNPGSVFGLSQIETLMNVSRLAEEEKR